MSLGNHPVDPSLRLISTRDRHLCTFLFLTGGISGQIFGSPAAKNGDFVETSPIVGGVVDSGYVVTTIEFLYGRRAIPEKDL